MKKNKNGHSSLDLEQEEEKTELTHNSVPQLMAMWW